VTSGDFHQWLDRHSALFPTVERWLAGNNPDDPVSGERSIAIQAAWFKILGNTTLDHARAASERLYLEGTLEKVAKGDHARAVLAAARDISKQGQWTGGKYARPREEYSGPSLEEIAYRLASENTGEVAETYRQMAEGLKAKRLKRTNSTP